jgi:hypothetical protein
MGETDRATEVALAEYGEVVAQFRSLTDIRFKLLTYLPLGTVATVFLSKDEILTNQPAIAAFALVVTVCIATYNKRNDQLYDELVSRAAELEREHLDLPRGAFAQRPTTWLRYGGIPVQHRWPVGLLYAATAALWAYLLVKAVLANLPLQQTAVWCLEALAPISVILGWRLLKRIEDARQEELREAVRSLKALLVTEGAPASGAKDAVVTAVMANKRPFGFTDKHRKKVERRIEFQWPDYEPRHDSGAGSYLLSAVIDLPARWIEDLWTGRR